LTLSLFARSRAYGSAKILIAAVAAAFCLLAALGVGRASAAEGCGYGAGGPYASNLCWFDMSGYNDAKARSAEGQQMSITLPGGYVAKFRLTSRQVPGVNWRGVESRTAPLETRFAFGVSGYVGIPGKPVLYSQGGTGPNGVELKLSNISVVDSGGQPVTGYKFVIADAENNIAGENFTWASDKPLNLVGVLNEKAPAGCHKSLSGLGTTSVTCTGQGGEVGQPNPRYDDVLVGADTPSSIALSMTTFARSGVAFAIMTSKIQVTKNVVGRVRGSDSFDVSALSPESSTLATASTGPANTATTGEITVLPLSTGASYTLSEAPTAASGTRQTDYSRSWACTNNGVAEPSLPSGSGPSVAVSPQVGDFIACTVTNTQLPAELSIEKTANRASASPGEQITYTLKAENNGPSMADSTTVTDTLPAGLAYVSDDAGCNSAAPPVIECELGTLAAGESQTIHVTAEVLPGAAGSLQTNTAKVSALQPDSEPEDNKSSVSTPITPFADLAISKSVNPQVASTLGQQVTFTLEVENKGQNPSAATVTDVLPPGLAYVSDDAGCDAGSLPTITCEFASLGPGVSATIGIVAEVKAIAAGKANTNTASVTGPLFDPDPLNDEASATLEVEPLADLAITKTTAPGPVKPGENITYTIQVENKGPTTDPVVEVVDSLPAGLEYVSDDSGCDSFAPPALHCEAGSLAKGQSRTITVVAKVVATSGSIENTAEVSGAIPDAELANNSSTVTTPVEPTSDLAIAKTASAPTVRAGETLTYLLQVENKGPLASGATTVTDTLPAGLSYVSDDGGCLVSAGREISCDLGSLGNGESRSIHVLTQVAAAASGLLENTAAVAGSNFDPELGDNEASANTAVEEVADLAIAKTASAGSAKPGEQLTYTLAVENRGPSASSPTTVTDTLPAGLSYVSDDSGCDVSALPAVSCDLGSLANGATDTVHIVTQVTAGAGSIQNSAKVEGPLPDPEPANDEASATTAVEPVSDLALTKTAGAAAVKAGERITYTLAVENKGPSASNPTTVTDTLPAQLTYVSDTGGCDTSALPAVSCDLGELADGATRSIEIVAEVKAGADGEIENSAQVTGPNPDPEPESDEARVRTPIVPFAADLELEKTASVSGPVRAGDTVTYTLATTDNGPDASPETLVTDDLPAGLTYVSDDAGCDVSALPKVECDLGTLANGETKTVQIVTRVAATGKSAIVNTAVVRGAHSDPVAANNPDSAEITIAPPPSTPPAAAEPGPEAPKEAPKAAKPHKPGPKRGGPRLVLDKRAATSFARPGSVIAYTITLWNRGDGDARDVKVCDEPPAQQRTLRLEPAVKNQDAPCWHLAKLRAGAKRVFRLTAEVEADSGSAVQRNRARVEAANVKGVRTASAPVRVKPLPGGACGSRLMRPSSAGPRLRC
jgi:uncharacterized repeat protein (TIGR01451 family)